MTRVLLVDDQPLVRAGFRQVLAGTPDIVVVGEAGDGRAAIEAVKQHAPDVVVMDIRMPRMDGLTATAHVLALDDAPRVLILTTFDVDEYVYRALRLGASGFLLKDSPLDDLVAGIRVVAHGDALLAPSVTMRVIERFASLPGEPDRSAVASLTGREVEVLKQVARGMSNLEVAQELFISDATVKTHVRSMLGKLGLRDRTQLVVLAYESGLVVPGVD
ncbi:MAG: response regulator transcription factor [Nocardioidaceae bacterium]